MRTTLDINDALLVRAKAEAVRQRTSLTRLIEEGLALRLRSAPRMAPGGLPPLPVFSEGGGMAPGFDPCGSLGDWEEDIDHDRRRAGLEP